MTQHNQYILHAYIILLIHDSNATALSAYTNVYKTSRLLILPRFPGSAKAVFPLFYFARDHFQPCFFLSSDDDLLADQRQALCVALSRLAVGLSWTDSGK